MKKIITLYIAFLLTTKVLAGPSFDMSYTNYTQNLTFGASLTGMSVPANAGDSVRLSVIMNCGPYIVPYYWMLNGIQIPNTVDSSHVTLIVTQSCVYTCYINNCVIGSNYFHFYFNNINTTGIPSIQNINFLNVFPNAVTSTITIQLNSIKTNDVEISFFDINGKQLKTGVYKNVTGEFIKNENTEALSKGIYFVRIKAGDEMVQKKFVKH